MSNAHSKDGGLGGRASGFDVDAFVFSSNYLGSVGLDTDLNDEAFLPRQDVLSLVTGPLILDYCGQHSPDNDWGYGPDSIGAEGGLVLHAWLRGAAAGAVVGLLTATDPPGDTVTFALAGSSPFVLEGNHIKVASPLYFETRSSWTVTTASDDGQGGTYSGVLVINVSDVSEPVVPTGPFLDFGLAKEAVEPGATTT